jgi:hypothetical protein
MPLFPKQFQVFQRPEVQVMQEQKYYIRMNMVEEKVRMIMEEE